MLMLASFHVEHTAQLMTGKFLRGSEWDRALSKVHIFTPDCASSTLNDQQIKRTRYCHLVSLVAYSKGSMIGHDNLVCLSHLRIGATSSAMVNSKTMNSITLSTGLSLILKCCFVGIYVHCERMTSSYIFRCLAS